MAEPSGLLLFGVLFVGVLLVLAFFWLISRTKAFLRGEPFLTAQRFQQAGGSVKSLLDPIPVVTSRAELPLSPSTLSSLRTDDGRTETTGPQVKFTEHQLLTLYNGLRAQGMTRDAASQLLKAVGIPMNNNLWAKAAVPPANGAPAEDDDVLVTPFAGRRTRASFYPESPDLEYNDPPR